ncbi:glycosyl transferase family 2 [Nonlabens dokdonensis]|jgi:glycosyltransferase involved in cell wall biosynthesis|uniref:Glycosyltransferase n=2 Tax=Nonlabens dokdonensis TaxID=328515 RepID=L7WBD9_NONDD|nr:glycosyltransferase family A protein [Nonlabens dokdonensis]AGC77414.1 glycosyltransferase [Nonlabens dokdonensis DSW-6]PZX40940.1 glycosyl transferase family 2 [Nonlabens dokdonensis]
MTDSQPKISIIVPCYKQAHYLDTSLKSVLDQSYDSWECVIVNDGSPDHTEAVAHKWSEKDARFNYLKKENGGLSSARNAGIAVAKGVFILPLDADDVLHPNYLKETISVFDTNKKVAIVGCYSIFFKENIDNVVMIHKPKGNNCRNLLYVNQLVATSLYKKQLWEEVGGYDESMKDGFEDWDFWLSVTKRGNEYAIVPEPLFYYRKASQSMLVDTIKTKAEKVKEYLIHKHREIYIEDFDNCVRVFTHHLVTSRRKEQRLQQSLEYKIGKLILKPFKLLGLFKTKTTSTQ